MTTVFDVAAHLTRAHPGLGGMKLQKLVYYAQAWSVVWDGAPLFSERLEAWREGPVSPDLFRELKSGSIPGNPDALSVAQRETLAAVLTAYGERSGDWLSRLTHRERPWRAARAGLPADARSQNPITQQSLRQFYGTIAPHLERKGFAPEYLRGLDLLVDLPEEEAALLLEEKVQTDGASLLKWLETGDEECAPSE
jgi:uncharacterized phage-associated protein